MSNEPDPNESLRRVGITMLATILKDRSETLNRCSLDLARLGGGMAYLNGIETEDNKHQAVIFVLSGVIPRDLIEAFGGYCEGLLQDLRTSGHVTTIVDERSKKPPANES